MSNEQPGEPEGTMSEMEFMMEMLRGAIEPLYPPRFDELALAPVEAETDPSGLIESLCGADNSQDVEMYDGTLGVTIGFVAAHQRPVGQLQWNSNLGTIYNNPGNVSGVRWGSGTLIANNLFLTAGHCFDQLPNGWTVPRANGTMNPIQPGEIATNMHVNFNYQRDANGNLRQEQSYAVTQLVEYRLNGLDFAIVRLAGNPGQVWGTTVVAQQDATLNEMLCIIQHPAGVPKRIEAGPLSDFVGNFVRYNDIDTLGGTSGAGILGVNGRIVGVHTNGGCSPQMTGHNFGVRISAIRAASPTIQSLPGVIKFKFADDRGGFKKIVDDIKLKVTDDPKLKFADDPGGFKKIVDDPKLKLADDPKFKVVDDPIGKPIADPKGGFDPGGPFPGGGPSPIGGGLGLGGGAGAPFILATPHHTTPGGEAAAASGQETYQQLLHQYQAQLAQIEQAMQQTAAEHMRLEALYRSALAEYQALIAQYGGQAGQPPQGQ